MTHEGRVHITIYSKKMQKTPQIIFNDDNMVTNLQQSDSSSNNNNSHLAKEQ
jgi:hypothetical protein